MGFHEVSRVLEASKTTGYERLAIVALAHRVKDERGDGAAWPGVDTFAADVNLFGAVHSEDREGVAACASRGVCD